jgi:hypothetical protein
MTFEGKRQLNEKKFSSWHDLPDGGRRYFLEVKGKHGWNARYIKEVDHFEKTIKFYQEIFDQNGILIEIHEKFPEDRGHIKLSTKGG